MAYNKYIYIYAIIKTKSELITKLIKMKISEQRIKAMVVMNIIDNCTMELDNTGQERYSLDENQFGKVVDALVKNVKVMSSAIAFVEWVDWSKYERFEDRRDLWYDKRSSYTNPLPVKTTEDLWNEFVKHCS